MTDLEQFWAQAVRHHLPGHVWGFLASPSLQLAEGRLMVGVSSEIGLALVQGAAGFEGLCQAVRAELGVELSLIQDAAALTPELTQPEAPLPPAKDTAVRHGRPVRGKVVDPERMEDAEGPVRLKARLVTLSLDRRRDGGWTLRMLLTGGGDSVVAKLFGRADEAPPQLGPGMLVDLHGDRAYDRYEHQWGVVVRDLVASQAAGAGWSGRRRVEWHLHTRMSAMDGLIDPAQLMARAQALGLDGVVLTDHGVIQAFPEAYEAARRHGVRLYLGLEAYLREEPRPYLGPSGTWPSSLVAVDVETTSLSPLTGEVIELGAARISEGQVVDRFQALVRPTQPVGDETYRLTGIDAAELARAQPLSEVWPRFRQFVADDVLLAHNAAFDRGFLLASAQRMEDPWTPSLVDTLAVGRILFPDLRSHRLPELAAHLGMRMDSQHRAESDAATAGLVGWAMRQPFLALSAEALSEALSRASSLARPMHGQVVARSRPGLRSLYHLVTTAHLNGFRRVPTLSWPDIEAARAELLIGASACPAGELMRALLQGEPEPELIARAGRYDYLEVLPTDRLLAGAEPGYRLDQASAEHLTRRLVELGRRSGRPVIAVSDAHHLDPEQETLRHILHRNSGEAWRGGHLPDPGAMVAGLNHLGDEVAAELVFDATEQLAERLEAGLRPVPEGLQVPRLAGAAEEVSAVATARLEALYGQDKAAHERLATELQAILAHGFAPIYLLARRLTEKARRDGELVGSRGSVGSSFVAYLLEISEVNPLPPHWRCPACRRVWWAEPGAASGFDLPDRTCDCGHLCIKDGQEIPFETFLGFKGDKVPDIDLNFSGPYQAVIHRYVEELVGGGKVYRAGTISTIAERTAFGLVKAALQETGQSRRQAHIEQLAFGLVGVKRTTGQHPGGVIIVPEEVDVHDFTPLQHPADDQSSETITTHFDYNAISSRLLKLDLLGHDDPTVLRLLHRLTGVDPALVPLDDHQTLSVFSSTAALGVSPEAIGANVGTIGVPEFGTRFVRGMLEITRPKSFGELVRISGLSHGTDVWANNARELIRSGVASLAEVVATRDDIMLGLIAQGAPPETAFRLMEDLRKGRGLKDTDESFLASLGTPQWLVGSLKKMTYLFPKAHAAAYVMMAVRIAFFKVHHAQAFYAAYFSVRTDDLSLDLVTAAPAEVRRQIAELEQRTDPTAKERSLLTVLEVIREMQARAIAFAPLDINRSAATECGLEGPGRLLPPLSVLPGLGAQGAAALVSAREEQPFASAEDLQTRTRLSRPLVERLKREGLIRSTADTDQMRLF